MQPNVFGALNAAARGTTHKGKAVEASIHKDYLRDGLMASRHSKRTGHTFFVLWALWLSAHINPKTPLFLAPSRQARLRLSSGFKFLIWI
jgi:hypothetical protein